MVTLKTEQEIEKLREGGKRLARILAAVAQEVRPGVSTKHLDDVAARLIKEGGDTSAFLDYSPKGAIRPFPASLCVSINDEVVHGIPNERPRTLEEGDIVSIDLGLIHEGMYTDHAVTVAVGAIDPEAQRLLDITAKALNVGISAAQAGKKTGDIGFAIQEYIEKEEKKARKTNKKFRLGIIEELAGHGVGYSVHEDPFVPNYGNKGEGVLLKPGMVLAIEPMCTLGSHGIFVEDDGYTIRTEDGSRAAHFEHTIVITHNGPEILTRI